MWRFILRHWVPLAILAGGFILAGEVMLKGADNISGTSSLNDTIGQLALRFGDTGAALAVVGMAVVGAALMAALIAYRRRRWGR